MAQSGSYYEATANPHREFAPLQGTRDCDVCVVGGGYMGLSTALNLAERGYDTVLLEAETPGFGASGRNGGQLGSGQRMDQEELEELVGEADARILWDIAEESKREVKERIARHDIACDLKPGIITAGHKPALARWAMDYAEKLQRDYGYTEIRPVTAEEMCEMLGSKAYFGGSLDMGAAHLHPLNFALGLADAAAAAGASLHSHSRVLKIEESGGKVHLHCRDGRVGARYAVLGCNGYLGNLEPRIAGRIMPINNFILATEPLGAERARAVIRDDVAVADTRFVVNYFRLSADGRLLFGGGENYRSGFPPDLKGFVRRYMLKIYPDLADVAIDYAWGGTLGVTMKRMPHMGRLGNLFFAQGFSGHGVGMATMAGKLIAEALSGTAERFDVMARVPAPRFPGGRFLRWPGLVLGMMYYSLRDRL